MKKILFLVVSVLLLCSSFILAESHYELNPLPIGLTEEELTRLDEIGMMHTATAPPTGILRNPAEWEPSSGVIIRYPLGIPVSLVAEMSEDLMVTTIVSSVSTQNSASAFYSASGVNMANTQFIIAPTNTYWTRDYGPWFIFEDDNLAIVDPIYNRPRPQDDVIPAAIGSAWGLNVYGMDLITPGGNHMSDGLGTSSSTRLVIDENPTKTEAQIDSLMMEYLGNDYIIMNYIESGGIHHIDCWAKFLGPSTVMVKDVPSSSSSHALLDARADFLATLISPWGVPYTVVRVYCPTGTAYTNSIILNNKVLVPTFGISQDAVALQTYADAMPGYEVIGFNGSWLDDDAIHCRAMGVPNRFMVHIEHIPLTHVSDAAPGYDITCEITPCSGGNLRLDSSKVYYSIDGVNYDSVGLAAAKALGTYTATIPQQPSGSTVSYYIRAVDQINYSAMHPYIGQPWAHQFVVNAAPMISSADSFFQKSGTQFEYAPQYSDADDTALSVSYDNFPPFLATSNDSLVGTIPDTNITVTFDVTVADQFTQTVQTVELIGYMCGDVDFTNEINIGDLVYMVDFMFTSGPEPHYFIAGNIDAIAQIDIADLVALVDFMFAEGAAPICE